ncbi:helix-turn-helix transcriptional regulator [Fodinicola acaciae]|uniref:helix-turn-helix transcriptional regulator n=1 Tax=Fodinicola acaciae TaxID=2681555 RepID=UPI0013D60C5F|nr:helix-turn-helix transcriptional regulator [Fodinicola acaciae]
MPAHDLIKLPATFWDRPQVCAALRARDLGHLFRLLRQYHQITQTQIGTAVDFKQGRVSEFMRGQHKVESILVLERVADGLGMPDAARQQMGLAPRTPAAVSATSQGDSSDLDRGLPSWDQVLDAADKGADDPMRRRDFLSLAGASTLAAAASTASRSLTDLLLPFPLSAPTGDNLDPAALLRTSGKVRQLYQASRYNDAAAALSGLVPALQIAATASDGLLKSRLHAAISDAYHVIAGILLKVGNDGLAAVAADRSMSAAKASENPVTLGASARIFAHALMGGGNRREASAFVNRFGESFQDHLDIGNDSSLSVYGSLLLRGAVAAARANDRDTALELVGEADRAATLLGHDGNHAWTAFGPTNVLLHRVNLAVELGDAGTAISTARQVDDTAIAQVERRATFYLDVAAGFNQWGKHEPAFQAVQHAEAIAPEELRGRPSVHALVQRIESSAPLSLRPHVHQLATRIGAA